MNLDQDHPEGKPSVQELAGFGTVRLPLRWRKYQGESLLAAIDRQRPYIQALTGAGKTVIAIIPHEFGLEGQGYDWHRMTPDLWDKLIVEYAANVEHIARRFGDSIVYQLWNEPDGAPTGSSVLMPAQVYGKLFRRSWEVIREFAPSAKVITAGLKSGPVTAAKYFRDAQIKPSAIAIHEYGRGGEGNPDHAPWGRIEESLVYWRGQTNLPIIITEWGILNDKPGEDKAAGYVTSFLRAVQKFPQVKDQNYFAYGNQHNALGVVGRPVLRTALVQGWSGASPGPAPSPAPEGREWVKYKLGGNMNFRSSAEIRPDNIRGVLRSNDVVWINEKSFIYASGHGWKECFHPEMGTGQVAIVQGVGRIPA